MSAALVDLVDEACELEESPALVRADGRLDCPSAQQRSEIENAAAQPAEPPADSRARDVQLAGNPTYARSLLHEQARGLEDRFDRRGLARQRLIGQRPLVVTANEADRDPALER